MKKITQIITVLICSLLFTTSCHTDDETDFDEYERDKSLAGSVTFGTFYYIEEAEGTYDETSLKGLSSYQSFVDIHKISDTEISLYCYITWGTTTFKISTPKIPLSGVPYDVTFDYTSDAISAAYNENPFASVNGTVKGWIRKVDLGSKSSNEILSKTQIGYIDYDCEINITCTIEGKPLNLKITSINPHVKPLNQN